MIVISLSFLFDFSVLGLYLNRLDGWLRIIAFEKLTKFCRQSPTLINDICHRIGMNNLTLTKLRYQIINAD